MQNKYLIFYKWILYELSKIILISFIISLVLNSTIHGAVDVHAVFIIFRITTIIGAIIPGVLYYSDINVGWKSFFKHYDVFMSLLDNYNYILLHMEYLSDVSST